MASNNRVAIRSVGELRKALAEYSDEDELHLHVDLWAECGISMTLDPGLIKEIRTEPASGDNPGAACLMIGEWP